MKFMRNNGNCDKQVDSYISAKLLGNCDLFTQTMNKKFRLNYKRFGCYSFLCCHNGQSVEEDETKIQPIISEDLFLWHIS